MKLANLVVQTCKRCFGSQSPHPNTLSVKPVKIKGMQGLPQSVQDIIGDVYHCIDRPLSYRQQSVLKPQR